MTVLAEGIGPGIWGAKAEVNALRHRAGCCPVEIEYSNGSAACRVRLGEGWRVRPDDLLIARLREAGIALDAEVLYE